MTTRADTASAVARDDARALPVAGMSIRQAFFLALIAFLATSGAMEAVSRFLPLRF